ncbi:MAG: hypothetical protein PVG60_06060 [Desulfarculaceae bacterium]
MGTAMVGQDGPKLSGGVKAAALLGLAVLALAVAHTHPLWRYLTQGIPYGYHVVPGFELVPLMPGDHLQFFYWCWLLVDNIFGPSSLLTNPYEFNSFLSQGLPGFANFPFSLLYVILYPLGAVPAYNALVLLSYVLAGLCAYALALEVLGSRLAAIPAGLIFALLPFRAAQVLSGHLYGFVAFLLPLSLWCLERGLRLRSWRWGAGAGLCLVAMGLMEGHLVYYTSLLMGPYVVLRLLVENRRDDPGAGNPIAVLGPLLGGLGLGLTVHLRNLRMQTGDFWSLELALTLGLCLLICLCLWLLLSWLTLAVTDLDLAQSRRLWSRSLQPLLLAPAYAIQFVLDIPHLGSLILVALVGWGLTRSLPSIWRKRRRPQWPQGIFKPVWALAGGLALAAGHMLYVKARSFDSSIAGGGRGLHEVKLFTPHLENIFQIDLTRMEELIYPTYTLIILAVAGLALLCLSRPNRGRQGALAAIWASLGLVSLWLSLGPTVGPLPLYELLYQHLPFFNFPRVPGRMILVAVLLLSLLAGWALRELTSMRLLTRGRAGACALALVALLAWDLWPKHAAGTGICLLPPAGPLEQAVKKHLPTGPDAKARLLGLPIWPGDSHQSSIYELMIARTRAKMVNGYSPVVPRKYIEQVFKPLYPLDLGLVDAGTLAALQKNRIKAAVFWDDYLIYASKVSPFPPALARQRLAASGAFKSLAQHGNAFLWEIDPQARPDPRPGAVISPVTSVWQPHELKHQTGRLLEDSQASGWGLLFQEQPEPGAHLGPRIHRLAGNVAQAKTGRDKPGFLSFGPYWVYPPGRYLVRFRVRRGAQAPKAVAGFVDVAADFGRLGLARLELAPEVLPPDQKWHEVRLVFEIKGLTNLEFRTYFSGNCDLELDAVLVSFEQAALSARSFRAQDLWRQTGDLVADARVKGGLAVRGQAGFHPPRYLMHGPQLTCPPGRYLARFRLSPEGQAPPAAEVCHLEVALDKGRRVLGHLKIMGKDLAKGYRDYEVGFHMPRRAELGLRVKFLGGASVRVAGVEIVPDG